MEPGDRTAGDEPLGSRFSSPGLGTRALAALGRSNRAVRIAAQGSDLVHELGLRGARRYREDRVSARSWTKAARRTVYTDIWAEAARIVGADREGLGDDFTLLRRGGARTVTRFHHVQLDDPVTLQLALDKALTHRLLRHAGVAVPVNREFTPADPAPGLALLREWDGSFVVKPASGTSGGSGVTCAVDSVADFHRAALHASRLTERLLIERSLTGGEYRFLFLDGELLDVIRRRPTHVVGNGRSSVGELISRENEGRARAQGRRGTSFLDSDLDCVLTLDQARLTLRSRLADGVAIPVKSAANENGAEDNVTVELGAIGDALVEEARRAVSTVRLRLAGVDLITPDVTRPLGEVGGAVIEVNSTPGLHYHYLVADTDRATKVAVPVLRTLLDESGRSRP